MKNLTLTVASLFVCINIPFAQTYTMIADASYTTCGGVFYDGGGVIGNYSENQDITVTFYPSDPNQKISVTFNYFKTFHSADVLVVYDGDSADPQNQIAELL